ncbi:MAG: fused MFS/spermidine synthase [Phycisphaerae bacterium]|nr:fused MFS/spermidine synthase [Phycisphaerae bacterium]
MKKNTTENRRWNSTGFYALTIFMGAFLLFQIQPLIGKFILPWFGGSPEVWTTCMLFFQVLLLGGYAYAHLLVTYVPPRGQAVVHIGLIIAAILMLPITPDVGWRPVNNGNPTWPILVILARSIGLPYFVLSSTGPLIQRWFSQTRPGQSPYWLYALSNTGSLLALVTFPFIVEPFLRRKAQGDMWAIGLWIFAGLCGYCAVRLWNIPRDKNQKNSVDQDISTGQPGKTDKLLWLMLPATASVMLLAVTNIISQDVATVPFFWVLPLSVYLVSFIISFHSERWYHRTGWIAAFILAIIGLIGSWKYAKEESAVMYIAIHAWLLLTCCMVCHGELYKRRPPSRFLTPYYLMIATGGAIGGILVAIVAPLLFNTYLELPIALLATFLLIFVTDNSGAIVGRRRVVWTVAICVLGIAAITIKGTRGGLGTNVIQNARNFFGVVSVMEEDKHNPAMHRFVMRHGTTFHGVQFVGAQKHNQPTAYYGKTSGVGLAMKYMTPQTNRRIGVVGLGVGTLAAYGNTGDLIKFYEINPEVQRLAQTDKWFTYLKDCPAELKVVIGDARLSMETEPPQEYDLLVMDAFSSDAVPLHLLTTEAFEIYLKHIKTDGIIAFHVSTIHLDLQSVLWKLADHFELGHAWIIDDEAKEKGTFTSDWILLTRNKKFLATQQIQKNSATPGTHWKNIDLWTDDHVNLFEILK